MKSIFTTLAFSFVMALCLGTSAYAFVPVTTATTNTELSGISLDELKTITPKQFTEITGKKLNIAQIAAMKYTQHKLKKAGNEPIGDDKMLMILLAILIPPVAVYLLNDEIGKDFWINIILTLLCGIPGIIHALILVTKKFK